MLPVISIQNLNKKYDDFTAVKDLELTIYKGEVFGLLGPNGAGKTTTILMILGLAERTSGQIEVLGLDPMFDAIQIKRQVGYMPDDIGFYDDRTAIENLVYTARLNGIAKQRAHDLAQLLLARVGLSHAKDKKVATFSRGMRQRLGLADVLIKQPQIIILDEPTLGIDPEGVRDFLELITKLSKEEGITVILSSHHLQQVQQVCDRVGLFVGGQLISCGPIDELAQKLNEGCPITIKLQCKLNNRSAFEEELTSITCINRYEAEFDNTEVHYNYTLYCNESCTSHIAEHVLKHGALLSIQQHHYNLDDIYHRYFSGAGVDLT